MPDKAKLVSSVYSPAAVTGETSIVSSPALRHLLLAENEFAPSTSSYRCISVRLIYVANIFCLLSKKNLLQRDLAVDIDYIGCLL